MAGAVKVLNKATSPQGGAQQLLPDRGKGVKRAVYVHVVNAAANTAFFAHDKQTLTQPDTLGNPGGIPVGLNGGVTPFTFMDWEGPMWAVSSVDSVQVNVEEGFA